VLLKDMEPAKAIARLDAILNELGERHEALSSQLGVRLREELGVVARHASPV
jgi:hypothetical protein